MVCYDANGNYGDLVTRTYVTKSATDVWDAPCQLTGTETEWKLNVTKQSNCAKYYLLTNQHYENSFFRPDIYVRDDMGVECPRRVLWHYL